MARHIIKTASKEERRKYLKSVFDFWTKNKTLNMQTVCNKYLITEERLRAWLRVNNLKRPDGVDRTKRSERTEWVIKGYNTGLDKDWDANQAARWATEQSGKEISRGEIQSYASRFSLPLLREAVRLHLTTSKYG
jgi:hypothetical protein